MSRPGNSNAGHTYGTTLSAEEKRALLEVPEDLVGASGRYSLLSP